jgi:hypothetical protein
MLLSLVYFVMRCLLQAMAPSARGDFKREVELLVLRHQLKVLSRVARRPPFRRQDRMLLAAASRILPHPRWSLGAESSPTGLDKKQFHRWFAAPGTWLMKREVNAV